MDIPAIDGSTINTDKLPDLAAQALELSQPLYQFCKQYNITLVAGFCVDGHAWTVRHILREPTSYQYAMRLIDDAAQSLSNGMLAVRPVEPPSTGYTPSEPSS